jgi:hypothetical protein
MIHLRVTVLGTTELLDPSAYGAGALLRWESSPTEGGSYAEGGSVPLVAGQSLYDIWDAAGTPGVWYKTRVSDAAAATFSPYSDPQEGGTSDAYASLEDVLALFNTPVKEARHSRLESLLATTAEEINEELGRDYFRHPAVSGTETRTFNNARYGSVICVHSGVVSLDSLEVRAGPTSTYETVDPTDIQLEPLNPDLGRPYDHIRLLGVVSRLVFPVGSAGLRATGVFGWATPPKALVEANAERTRQIYSMDGSYSGSAVGPDEYGAPRPFTPLPDVLYRFMRRETERYLGCTL